MTSVRRGSLALAVAAALTAGSACTTAGSSAYPASSGPSGSGGVAADDPGERREAGAGTASAAALRSAERATSAADSARVESSTTMGAMMSMKATGALSWGDGLTGTLTLTYTGGTVAEAMRRLGSTTMEARYLPDAYYARMGDAFAAQAGGRHWLRYVYQDLEHLADGSGAQLGDQMRDTAPHQSVKLLLACGDARKVGEEWVRGDRTTHYTGTVDVAGLATRDSGLDEDQVADLKERLTRAGVTTQTVDIWVDDRDLLVKKVERAQTASGELTQTAYYSDYGVKVSAEVPPAGDTKDFKELVGGHGSLS
ncbi:hypothetical protein [Streptomyces triticisoli]|uniref:hypothetical protein n=1 Tax=Streptomyces triticisoli TaxID=2182797 RepID=UPI001E4C7CDE|nr:hypothetical protein [Streptomyces triticisoli]